MILGLALSSFSFSVQAAPPKKDICPAPASQAARQAAVDAACQHFGRVSKSWGMHSAFNSSGQVISCIHFKCKRAPHGFGNPNPGQQDQGNNNQPAATPKRFLLKFQDASLVHIPASNVSQITAQGNVLSYGNDWQVRKLKPYLYHFKQNNWSGFYWKVNTSRGEVYRVKNGNFGQLGGNEQKINIGVDAVGNANNPTRFSLRFHDAYLVHKVGTSVLQIASQGNVLSYGGDWQVRKLKPYLFHVKQNNWQGFHWQINTSRKQAHRVKGGQFGQIGGNKTKLNMVIDPVY
jgi:predicted secreted protein